MKKEKPQMNLVVIGHVDAGKSTSTGHLIYLNGGIDQRTLDKYRKEAELIGKGSFCFAWILDTLKSERDRGITIKATLNKFETAKNQYTIIDAPGHRDFIKNMITGTTQADAAVLVVSAQGGEFEAGISPDGQTKEHALLAYTLGVKEMIVAVNKMDHPSVKYSEERFNEVVSESKIFLKNAGYKPDKITFVPISGWTGENLKEKSDNLAWYKGPTLMVALDSLPQPERPTALPLRLPINDVYKISGVGTVACGRVETGILKKDTLLSFCPGKVQGDCRSIEKHHEEVDEACPGDNIGFNVRGVDAKVLKKGTVVSDARNKPASEVTDFLAHVVILNHPNEINSGYTPVVDCHAAHVACRFNELKQKVDKRSGKVIEENPKSIKNGDAALVQLIPQKPMCVEVYKEFAPLGRFAVRDMKQTVAVGIIKECTRKTESLKK